MSVASPIAPPLELPAPTTPAARPAKRLGLLFSVIVVTSVIAAALSLLSYLRPIGGAAALPGLSDIAPVRAYVWSFYVVAGCNLVVGVFALALAAWILTPARGARWATVGGSLMCVGAAVYGIGVGGWAAVYYFASDTVRFGTRTTTALVDSINADGLHILGIPMAGAALLLAGVVVVAVGLWQAYAVPRGVLVIGVSASVATFLLAPASLPGVVAEAATAVTSIALGWCVWHGFVRPDWRI